ncbi:hypothetical protein FHX42_000906 [Saccharopolyspora lacisalsi]|uniref:Uncharacterized protein n=1 Tax=Halosaccharopolyspora lacisalsi TaxID=1000566 RepID=A0A839DVW8_9PSEU|nr:hypothetical protein [Halosaccharopolyspora lacisalsi]MBA8823577.1 hypothetical protein [Halosaccharopolyspora lacisalsi]
MDDTRRGPSTVTAGDEDGRAAEADSVDHLSVVPSEPYRALWGPTLRDLAVG